MWNTFACHLRVLDIEVRVPSTSEHVQLHSNWKRNRYALPIQRKFLQISAHNKWVNVNCRLLPLTNCARLSMRCKIRNERSKVFRVNWFKTILSCLLLPSSINSFQCHHFIDFDFIYFTQCLPKANNQYKTLIYFQFSIYRNLFPFVVLFYSLPVLTIFILPKRFNSTFFLYYLQFIANQFNEKFANLWFDSSFAREKRPIRIYLNHFEQFFDKQRW